MEKPFRFFFHLSLGYHAIAVLLVVALRDNWKQSLQFAYFSGNTPADFVSLLSLAALVALIAVLSVTYFMEDRIPRISFVFATLGTLLFIPAFLMIKSLLPLVFPYFADPLLASVDESLHFGTDPWKFTHFVLPQFPVEFGSILYSHVWYGFSILAPTAVAALDPNRHRQTRFVIAYAGTWIILGNLLALALLSGGPVFYDRLTDTSRFAEFDAAFAASGFLDTYVAQTQTILWTLYTDYSQSFGSGISAFPSLHVAMAMLYTVYLCEISRAFGALAGAFLIFVLYFSVHSGFHYAIDGYVSIGLVYVGWRWLLRRELRNDMAVAVSAAS